jgi:hypothetical protein
MSNAIGRAHGKRGRIALLDKDASLVSYTHLHRRALFEIDGAVVGSRSWP